MKKYVLNSHLRISYYASGYYAYDARVSRHPMVEIPTRKIPKTEYEILNKFKTDGFFLNPRSQDETLRYFLEESIDSSYFGSFLQKKFLKEHSTPEDVIVNRVLGYFNSRYIRSGETGKLESGPLFEENNTNLDVFSSKSFFNLPDDIDPQTCHVGLIGFPHASLNPSLGTEAAPNLLRLFSRSLCWLDIHKSGIYSEILYETVKPEIFCKDVVVKDFGDLDYRNVALPDMFNDVEKVLEENFFDHNIYPMFIGGDHAITFPIVLAYLKKVPDLGLLHLDAHNDLFYSSDTSYSHAATISNILKHSKIKRILSFGLRTFSDMRTMNLQIVDDLPNAAEQLHFYNLTRLKQLIMTPLLLAKELEPLADRPYYLTIDLDILSENAIGHQLSTPFGAGLEWHELFYFLMVAFQKLNIIACDIVEYNAINGENYNQSRYYLNSLLILILNWLASNNQKFEIRS